MGRSSGLQGSSGLCPTRDSLKVIECQWLYLAVAPCLIHSRNAAITRVVFNLCS